MIGTIDCVYETPCGWCSKWDKKCDKKILEQGPKIKCGPVLDSKAVTNEVCKSELDHEWDGCGISTAGITYVCKKCHARKTIPFNFDNETSITY